jgi:hypothetical protein
VFSLVGGSGQLVPPFNKEVSDAAISISSSSTRFFLALVPQRLGAEGASDDGANELF